MKYLGLGGPLDDLKQHLADLVAEQDASNEQQSGGGGNFWNIFTDVADSATKIISAIKGNDTFTLPQNTTATLPQPTFWQKHGGKVVAVGGVALATGAGILIYRSVKKKSRKRSKSR